LRGDIIRPTKMGMVEWERDKRIGGGKREKRGEEDSEPHALNRTARICLRTDNSLYYENTAYRPQ